MRVPKWMRAIQLFWSILLHGAKNVYQCDRCGRVYQEVRDDSEAFAEHDALFPGEPHETAAIVCDDCWKAMGFGDEQN